MYDLIIRHREIPCSTQISRFTYHFKKQKIKIGPNQSCYTKVTETKLIFIITFSHRYKCVLFLKHFIQMVMYDIHRQFWFSLIKTNKSFTEWTNMYTCANKMQYMYLAIGRRVRLMKQFINTIYDMNRQFWYNTCNIE